MIIVLNEKNNINSFIEEHFSKELTLAFEKEKKLAIATTKREFEAHIKTESLKLEHDVKKLAEERRRFREDVVNSQEKTKLMTDFIKRLNTLFSNIEIEIKDNREIIKSDSVKIFVELMNSIYNTNEKVNILSHEIKATIDDLDIPLVKIELSNKLITDGECEIPNFLNHLKVTYSDELEIDEANIYTDNLKFEISPHKKNKLVKKFLQGLVDEI